MLCYIFVVTYLAILFLLESNSVKVWLDHILGTSILLWVNLVQHFIFLKAKEYSERKVKAKLLDGRRAVKLVEIRFL